MQLQEYQKTKPHPSQHPAQREASRQERKVSLH